MILIVNPWRPLRGTASSYRVLDDPALMDGFLQHPEITPVVARVTREHNMAGDAGETMAHLAAITVPYPEVVRMAMNEMADVNARDEAGRTVLHSIWDEPPMEEAEGYWIESTRIALALGVNPNLRDDWGRSALSVILEGLKGLGTDPKARALEDEAIQAAAKLSTPGPCDPVWPLLAKRKLAGPG